MQPYPSDSVHIPGALDEGEYESAKASLELSKVITAFNQSCFVTEDRLQPKPIDPEIVVHSYTDLYPAAPMLVPRQEQVAQNTDVGDLTTDPPPTNNIVRGPRKTHVELHDLVLRVLGKQRARISKTHLELHTEVFQDGVVWTPSGYMQDLTSMMAKKCADLPPIPVPESRQRRTIRDHSMLHPPRSRPGTAPSPEKSIFPLEQSPALALLSLPRVRNSGTAIAHSPEKLVFPLEQPSTLLHLPLPRARSSGIPSPAVSEVPTPHVPSPTRTHTHVRTTSLRLSHAVKSMMSVGHKRSTSSATLAIPPREDRKLRAETPPKLLLADRRPAPGPPPLHTNGHKPEFLTRPLRKRQSDESVVAQQTTAYEEATGEPFDKAALVQDL